MTRFRPAVLALALLAPTACFSQANANKAEITGTVYDAKQAAVPNAAVTVRNVATGLERTLPANESGRYRAVLLDAGIYRVTATSQGFAPAIVEGVRLAVGSSVAVDLTVQVQSTTTSIDVGETMINPVQPAPSTLIHDRAIANLPISGRRFQDFAVLTPSVQVDPQRGQLSFAGQRGVNSNIMLDGGDYNQPFFGGIRGGERSNSIITVPQSAIQEFQVVTTGYSAEYGRSTGGILNTITKSGSNDIHGEALYLLRHKELGSKDPVQGIASLETLQQYGGGVGGPLQRDRLFFFAAVERQASATPRRVFFAQLLNRPVSAAGQEAFDFFQSEQRAFTQTNDALASTARLDHQTSKGHRLTVRYNFSDATANNAVSAGGALDPFTNRAFSNDGIEKDRIHNGAAQYTRILSPAVVNDLRFIGSFEERPRLANSEAPQIDARPIGIFGARNFLPTTQDDRRYQLADALSATRGSHTLKAGFDFNHIGAAQVFGFNQFGAFTIASSNVDQILDILGTGGAVSNRLDSPLVTYDRQSGNLTASMSMRQVAAFVQDSWRVTHGLTLDAGLRWEGQYNPKIDANNTSVIDRIRGFRFSNGATLDPTVVRNDVKQLMPRLGFAWSPFSGSRRTVIRGHTGIFYASTPLIVMAAATNNFRLPPGDVSIRLAPIGSQTVYRQLLAVGVDLNQSPLGQLPVIPLETVQRASALALGTVSDPFAGASLIAMASDFTNPRSVQAGLGFDSEVFGNLVVGVQLNYLNTVHLQRNRDYNVPAPFVRAGDLTLRPTFGLRTLGVTRPIPTLGSITVRESSARSMYRGVTVSSQYRSRRLTLGAFYTWSETFSDDDTEREATGFNYANPFDFAQDYAYARSDIRHQFTSYGLLSLPLGFELGLIARARSGLPVNPTTGTDNNEEFGINDRPFSAPGVPLERNSFRNRKVINNDMRVMKNFRIGGSDTRRLQISAEFFNLLNLNNVVFAGANGGLSGGVYGNGIQAVAGQLQTLPVDPRFLRLRMPDSTYDRNNVQSGTPLQVQFGLRCFF